jgi:hypothetical protein
MPQKDAEIGNRSFLLDGCVNLLGLISAGPITWGRHWSFPVLGGIVVMVLLIRLIWKIRRIFNREPLRPGSLIRPRGTPEGRKISNGALEGFSRTNR